LNFCLPISASHLVLISGSSNFCLAFQSEYLRYCSFYLLSLFCSLFPVVLPVITLTVIFAEWQKEKDVAPIRYFGITVERVNEIMKSPNQIICSFSTWYSTL